MIGTPNRGAPSAPAYKVDQINMETYKGVVQLSDFVNSPQAPQGRGLGKNGQGLQVRQKQLDRKMTCRGKMTGPVIGQLAAAVLKLEGHTCHLAQ